MTINQNLRDLRLAAGMTQQEAADRVHVTRQAISSYESGRTRPDVEMLMKLAEVYGADLDAILYGRSAAQRDRRAIRRAAMTGSALVLGLTLIGSAAHFALNKLIQIPNGAVTGEMGGLIRTRFAVLWICRLLQGLTAPAAWVCCVILAVLLARAPQPPRLRTGLLWAMGLTAGLALFTVPFGLADPLYGLFDYLAALFYVLPPVLLLLIYWVILHLIRQHRGK